MATTGHLKGVAQIGGLRLSGLPAWMLWRAYYLMRMPTLGRKVRIWVEWTWGMFFAADITHLRFTRTSEVDDPATLPPVHPVSASTSHAAHPASVAPAPSAAHAAPAASTAHAAPTASAAAPAPTALVTQPQP